MNSRTIATLAIAGTLAFSAAEAAHAGILFEAVKTVGKEIINKAAEKRQERERRAFQQQRAYEQQRARQLRAQRRARQQRAAQQATDHALQAPPAEAASSAATPGAQTQSRL